LQKNAYDGDMDDIDGVTGNYFNNISGFTE